MESEIKCRIIILSGVISLFLFPIMLLEVLEDVVGIIFLFGWYIGFIWLFLLNSKTGKALLIKYDDWLHRITGGNWHCNNCGEKYNWKERQPILAYMIQQRVGHYTEPLYLKVCHKHFVSSDMIEGVKSKIDEAVQEQYNIQWSRDGTYIPDWFNAKVQEVEA